jgi:hypothetical protein
VSRRRPENRVWPKLREALEPNASTIDAIPPFDLTVAHELYDLLLKPVEAAWRPAESLVVATNGALGLLPLAVLPTAVVDVTLSRRAVIYRLS